MSRNLRRLRVAVIALAAAGGLALAGCGTSAAGKDPTAPVPGSVSAGPAGGGHSGHPGSSTPAAPQVSISTRASSSAAGPGTPADSDTTGACAALVKVDAIAPPDGGPDAPPPSPDEMKQFGQAVLPPLKDALAKADSTLAVSLQVLVPIAEAAARQGTPIPEDDKVGAATAGYHAWAHRNCGFQTIDVTAIDYEFQGVPATLTAGPTSIALTNHSDKGEFHVALVVRPKDPTITTVEQLLAIPMPEMESGVDMFGAVSAPPGATDGTLLDLAPGRYFLVCPVPVGGDDGGADLHMMHGMATVFDVA